MKDVKKIRRLPGFWLGTKPTSPGYLRNLGIGTPQFTSEAPKEDVLSDVRAMLSNYIPNVLLKLTLNAQLPLTALTNTTEKILEDGTKKTVLNSVGKGAAIAGTLYGAGSMASDIIHAGENRTAGDMAKTMATNTYYTPGGHAYTQHGGINLSAELEYGNMQKRKTLTDFFLDSLSTGASAGSLVKPGGGTIVGSILGGLVGLGGIALGLGDNSEDIDYEAKLLADSTGRSDKLSRVLGLNLDVRDAFAKRGAVRGKEPIYGREGKANCMLSSGELYGNLEEGWMKRVPGRPNNKDTEYGRLNKDDYVIRNSLVPYVLATGDVIGALEIQDMDIRDKDGFTVSSKYDMAKCGKMPKYALGTTGEYGLAVLPHFVEFFQALDSENRARKAKTYIPLMELQSPELYAAINQVQSDMLNPTDYLRRFNREFNMANWNVRRNPGLGYGGRAIASSDLFGKKLAAYSDLWLKLQEANRALRNTAANMRFNLGDKMLSTQYDQFWKRAAASMLANAAKENWMEQARKNQVMAGINAAADALKMSQYNKALGIQNKMIDLYGDQANREWFSLRHLYPENTSQNIGAYGFDPNDPYGIYEQGRRIRAAEAYKKKPRTI